MSTPTTTEAAQYGRQARQITVKDANIKAALFYPSDGTARRMCYKVWHNGSLLFSGTQYKPSPMIDEDSKASIVELLSFIALQKSDTDGEYFKDYTPEQLAFADSHDAEKLGYFVSDWEENHPRGKAKK